MLKKMMVYGQFIRISKEWGKQKMVTIGSLKVAECLLNFVKVMGKF